MDAGRMKAAILDASIYQHSTEEIQMRQVGVKATVQWQHWCREDEWRCSLTTCIFSFYIFTPIYSFQGCYNINYSIALFIYICRADTMNKSTGLKTLSNWQDPCWEFFDMKVNFSILDKEIHKKCSEILLCWRGNWLSLHGN